MTLRNVPKSFTLEEQRQEVNEIAVDLDTAVDGVQTFSGDKTFSSNVTFQAQTFWGDGDQAVFGDDSDFKIYYDGAVGVQTSFIDSDALIIRSESDSDEKYITALKDGSVELYHNGAKKIATSLTGATVLGDLFASTLTGDILDSNADTMIDVSEGNIYANTVYATGLGSNTTGQIITSYLVASSGMSYDAADPTNGIFLTPGSDVVAAVFTGDVTGDVTGDLTGNSYGTHTGQTNGDVYTADGGTQVVDTANEPNPIFKGDAEGLTGSPNIEVGTLDASGLSTSGTVTSTTANNTYAFEVKNGNTNIGGLFRSGTSDTRLLLKNVSGTTIVLKGSDGSITADSITSTGSGSFGTNIDLPNANTYITGAGHNVLQVDATRSYFYGGTNGIQLRKSDNSSEIVTIDDDGNSVIFGDLSLNDDTKKLTTQKIEPVTPGSIMYIGSSDSGSSISFQSPTCVFDEISFAATGGLKLGIASGSVPTGATNGVLKTYLDGEFDATCDNGITLITGNDKLQWTRIGNLITVMGQIQIDSSNTNSALVINNLPYASYSSGDGAGYAVGAVRLYNAPMAGNHIYVICMTDIGTTNLLFQAVRDNTTSEDLPTADGAYYAFSITYRAA